MKATLRKFIATALTALVAVSAQQLLAGKPKTHTVHFKAKGIAVPTPIPPDQVSNALSGKGKLLGKWTGTSLATASVVGGVLHAEGTQEITAADGSTLTLFITGDFPNGFSAAGVNGTYLILGGTGRFAGATGSGVFTFGNVVNGARSIGYDGDITLVK